MKRYEMVREIFNECSRNQMRDVFFEEVETDDIEAKVRSYCKEGDALVEREDMADGSIVFHVEASGLRQRYTFTEV